jgi:outer membrane protein assembly factor BamB
MRRRQPNRKPTFLSPSGEFMPTSAVARSRRHFPLGRMFVAAACLLAVSAACDAQPPRGRTAPATVAANRNGRDWPQWRGPNRDGVSLETGLLKTWPEDGPPVAWKGTGIGEGYSSVSVAGDQVYTIGDLADACYLFALDRKSGEMKWKANIGKTGGGGGYEGPRSTPTVDDGRVYALGQFGDLVCVDATSGEVVWRKNIKAEFQGRSGGWSYTESPLVDGGKLVCTPGGRNATVVALDKQSGDVIWRGRTTEGDSAAYASPVVAEIGGVRQYVQLLSEGAASFAAEDGQLLWRYGVNRFGDNTANIPTPIVNGDRVFFSAGYGRGGGMVRVTKAGSDFKVEELWFNQKLQNKHGGVIWIGDYLYGDTDDRGLPWCADARTGKVQWEKRSRKGSGSSAVTYADGNLYWRFQNGVVVLAPATPDGFEETSSFEIPMGADPSWPHPVVVDGRLYLRDQNMLWCYDVRARE